MLGLFLTFDTSNTYKYAKCLPSVYYCIFYKDLEGIFPLPRLALVSLKFAYFATFIQWPNHLQISERKKKHMERMGKKG
jgi:hypothetical protein